MLKIYGRKNSSSVQLVMWTVGELGIAYKRLDYGHGYSSTKTDEYLTMNPHGASSGTSRRFRSHV